MNGTTGTTSTDLATQRDRSARARVGENQRTTDQIANAGTHVEPYGRPPVPSTVYRTMKTDQCVTDECTTYLNIYNAGPQCHACDARRPLTVDEIIG